MLLLCVLIVGREGQVVCKKHAYIWILVLFLFAIAEFFIRCVQLSSFMVIWVGWVS